MLIFTDLDGTLLDHESYDFRPAAQALEMVQRRNIPLILSSSKTRREIEVLQAKLGLNWPFICENGAAVYGPERGGSTLLKEFALPRDTILDLLRQVRTGEDYPCIGFAECDAQEIAAMTGLPLDDAALAAQRAYSEPLQWRGDETQRERFEAHIGRHGLVGQRGGRFLTVSSRCSKADAMRWLKQYYSDSGPHSTIALGDSHNDLDMLACADTAIIIRSRHSAALELTGPKHIIRSTQYGPAGWQETLLPLLKQESFNG